MRYKLINVVGDNFHVGIDIYHEDDIEGSKHIHQFKTSGDGIEYYHHPGVRSSFYISEIHPLFNASTAGFLGYDKYQDYIVDDITLNQLRGYTK